jgi:hypothetical protein
MQFIDPILNVVILEKWDREPFLRLLTMGSLFVLALARHGVISS